MMASRSENDIALNNHALSVWYAFLFSFLVWWLAQVAFHIIRAIRAGAAPTSVQLPMGEEIERSAQTSWASRLQSASEIGRDSLLMLFPAAVLISAVGATQTLMILFWTFFLLSVTWKIVAVSYGEPLVHMAFSILGVPLILATFVIGLMRA